MTRFVNLFVLGGSAFAANAAPTLESIYETFNKSFDHELHGQFQKEFERGMELFKSSEANTGYEYHPSRPHCGRGARGVAHVGGSAAFPGGAAVAMGTSFTKDLLQVTDGATGPAAVGAALPAILSNTGFSNAKALMQTIVAAAVHIVPPMVGPPAWDNQPLSCVPMVTGHNCFGAVLHLITAADFVLADVTDSMMDGVVAGFPATYAQKVGKTSDETYKACAAAYFSMHCASLFPRCENPRARDEMLPAGGRLPMCLHLCIVPLVMCPGFWVNDIMGPCSMVSVPPLCTQAFFWNVQNIPPQYASADDANPYPKDCPEYDAELDGAEDPSLYEVSETESPFAAKGSAIEVSF